MDLQENAAKPCWPEGQCEEVEQERWTEPWSHCHFSLKQQAPLLGYLELHGLRQRIHCASKLYGMALMPSLSLQCKN